MFTFSKHAQSRRTLIIDDDQDNGKMISGIFHHPGHEDCVHVAKTAGFC
jgi:hypothetical protein